MVRYRKRDGDRGISLAIQVHWRASTIREYEGVADFPAGRRGGVRADADEAGAGQEGRGGQERRDIRGGAIQVAGGDAHGRGEPQLYRGAGAGGGGTEGGANGGEGGGRGGARPADGHRKVRAGSEQERLRGEFSGDRGGARLCGAL